MPTDLREQLQRNLASAYVVDREIGRGGMATVYLARDLKHQRQVALKVLDPELGAVLGAERFLSEIRVTANLQHPNLLPLFDSGEADGLLYYVMPFVEGESLRARLEREKQLPIDEAVRVAVAIANALDYAHAHGVIHRDLKPENILLQHGQPVVADFGIALAVANAGGARVTQTGLSLGTPQYMSPEQATGDRVIDGRTDVYSLAAVTYELLAGEPPHSGTSAQAIIAKLMTTEPRPVRTLRPSVPANVAMAVERGLAKLPADRFASSKEFADALTNRAFTTMTASAAMPARRSASRLVLALAATSLVLLTATLWGWLRPMSQAPLLRYEMALDSAESIIATARYGRIALSPDGSALIYVSRSKGQLMLRRRTDLHATPIAGAENAGAPTFSPDGKRVAFIQNATTLMIASLDGSPPIAVTDSLFGLSGLTWGDDDVLYCDGRGLTPMVRVAARAHAKPEPFIALDSASGEFDQFFPDALPGVRAVLFTSQARNSGPRRASSIVAVDPRSGARHSIVENAMRARYVGSGHLLYVTIDGTLMAAPFDVKTLTLSGAAIVVGTGLSTETSSLEIASSHTGSVAYVTGGSAGDQRQAVWVSRDGKAQAVDPTWHGSFSDPALSPDGNRLAITEGVLSTTGTSDIWIRNLGNGALTRLTVEGGANRYPVWSMDGKRVIYSSITGDVGGLREKASDGSGTSTLLVRTQMAALSTLSPDRRWIVYSVGNGLQGRIYSLRTGDSTGRRVIDDDIAQRSPALSPDGKWLAYALNETSSGWQVFVSPFPNTASARWQVSRNGGADPQWSRRGAELMYRDNAGTIVAVSVSTMPSFSIGKPQELFSTAPYIANRFAVAPDGSRMLFFQRLGGADERLTFVENWTREFDRQAAAKR